jgi:hypothetical protein
VKGPALLLRWDAALNREGQPDFANWRASKIPCQGLTGGSKIFSRQVYLKVNRPSSSDSGLVIEPAISGNNDVVTVILGATRDAFRSDFETMPAEQFPQGNVAQLARNAVMRQVICPPLALLHECQI